MVPFFRSVSGHTTRVASLSIARLSGFGGIAYSAFPLSAQGRSLYLLAVAVIAFNKKYGALRANPAPGG